MFRGATTTDSITPFLPCTVIQARVAARLYFLVDDTPWILSRSFYQKARIKFPAATSSLAPGKENPSTAGKWCYIEHYAFGLWGSQFLPALTLALGWVPLHSLFGLKSQLERAALGRDWLGKSSAPWGEALRCYFRLIWAS